MIFAHTLYTHSHFVWDPCMYDPSHMHGFHTKCKCVYKTCTNNTSLIYIIYVIHYIYALHIIIDYLHK